MSNIIVIFETFLAKIYSIIIREKPLKYFENQSIPVSSIFNKKISEVVSEKIDDEVEKKMFNSIETLEFLIEKEKYNVDRFEKLLEQFYEIYYRRNIFVHNNGKTNKTYLSKIASLFKKELKIGQKLICEGV